MGYVTSGVGLGSIVDTALLKQGTPYQIGTPEIENADGEVTALLMNVDFTDFVSLYLKWERVGTVPENRVRVYVGATMVYDVTSNSMEISEIDVSAHSGLNELKVTYTHDYVDPQPETINFSIRGV
jgi:hypothetical protein